MVAIKSKFSENVNFREIHQVIPMHFFLKNCSLSPPFGENEKFEYLFDISFQSKHFEPTHASVGPPTRFQHKFPVFEKKYSLASPTSKN